ncbi:OLC1v1038771C1 [Oldenlandia corymbosa var. corymbosa]|uniref:MLO-like protein n=1 Tax=Oldenlandia corymbosa var. corymbosa TaxID=529605 RepID=A0AAV1D0I5_OLDCO|nr:OLC1v1038771C1 [Oldenlandia corymbosa var. corymbosa]
MATEEPGRSMGYTPTWVVTVVCFVIVLLSFMAERGLHRLGKFFKRKKQDSLYDALEKVKEELMLLGFISLLLTVFQGSISNICIPVSAASVMLPCKLPNDRSLSSGGGSGHLSTVDYINRRRLLATEDNSMEKCARKGMLPLLSLEALHQLHIFIFVLAVVHVIFCVSTMLLGGLKISQWKHWENSIRNEITKAPNAHHSIHIHHRIFTERAGRYWRKFRVVSWTVAFFKQFYGSVTKSDYIALRTGFIRAHCPSMPDFNFHDYMLRTLEQDFKKIVGISWYLWIFVMIFLLLNLAGWHSYFWLSFLPLILLLLVGAKLEHIITKLAKEYVESSERGGGGRGGDANNTHVKPSDELFWFHRPALVLYLIHFILFQNSFEMAFLFWVWSTYGFKSCIMEDLGFIIPRLVVGIIVQVLCSYSTLPLYALVTQMGSMFKQGMFDAYTQGLILDWARGGRRGGSSSNINESNRLSKEPFENPIYVTHQSNFLEDHHHQDVETSVIELAH